MLGVDVHGGDAAVGAAFLIAPAVFEAKDEVVLVLAGQHHAALGENDLVVVQVLVLIVDDDVVDGAAILIFLAHFDAEAGDIIVENAGPNVERGLAVAQVVEQGKRLEVGNGDDVIVKEKRACGDGENEDKQRPHKACERDAGAFNSNEFVEFAHVAEGHDAGQKDAEGQGKRHQCCAHVEQQLEDHPGAQTLADELVHVKPEKLHHKHEERHEKRNDKWANEGPDDEQVEFFEHGLQI